MRQDRHWPAVAFSVLVLSVAVLIVYLAFGLTDWPGRPL
jgi:hypothetical protein